MNQGISLGHYKMKTEEYLPETEQNLKILTECADRLLLRLRFPDITEGTRVVMSNDGWVSVQNAMSIMSPCGITKAIWNKAFLLRVLRVANSPAFSNYPTIMCKYRREDCDPRAKWIDVKSEAEENMFPDLNSSTVDNDGVIIDIKAAHLSFIVGLNPICTKLWPPSWTTTLYASLPEYPRSAQIAS